MEKIERMNNTNHSHQTKIQHNATNSHGNSTNYDSEARDVVNDLFDVTQNFYLSRLPRFAVHSKICPLNEMQKMKSS